jgi:hypothetical protein
MDENMQIEMYGMVREMHGTLKGLVARVECLEDAPDKQSNSKIKVVQTIAQWAAILAAVLVAVFRHNG